MATSEKPKTAAGYETAQTLACEQVLVTLLGAFGTLKDAHSDLWELMLVEVLKAKAELSTPPVPEQARTDTDATHEGEQANDDGPDFY